MGIATDAEGLQLPTAFGAPPASGRLRVTPEDFRVEEVLGFEPDGTGAHAMLFIEKRGANTGWVASQLARALRVAVRDVGWSGQKDRNAVTARRSRCRGQSMCRSTRVSAMWAKAIGCSAQAGMAASCGPDRTVPIASRFGCAISRATSPRWRHDFSRSSSRASQTTSARNASDVPAATWCAPRVGRRRQGTARPQPARVRTVGRAQCRLQCRAGRAGRARHLESPAARRGRHARWQAQLFSQ